MNNRNEQVAMECQRIAAGVRSCLGGWYFTNAGALRDILEVSPGRARALYMGRADYNLRELALVSAFFGVKPVEWIAPPSGRDYPRAESCHSANRAEVHARAWDRVMTARETTAA
ncbi:hypothetical protein [Agrococcus beijingensis]|uniref:hypothetical protein n=1 Tax=Agrococcus beijingensis TaxID=3068634 RepID=UPI0027423B1F|nr:hypothetical protein [Agrococcus sp. REN33]